MAAKFISPADAILGLTKSVTKDWTKQRRAEERDANAASTRMTRMVRSQRMTIKDAAFQVMADAYDKASSGGKLPVNPRQIYYAARRTILLATGRDSLESGYFLQTLLPAYMAEVDCDDWDLIWDARGHFVEPHTEETVPLGTLEVRQYVGDRPYLGSPVEINSEALYPTKGPEHRYSTVLFVEKEGFDPIFKASHLAERFDVAIMSTKGMSTTAARLLLDRLVDRGVKQVLALHDFDISGFSIFGTLGTDSGRYKFENAVSVVDIGLRLTDVDRLDLLHEPFTVKKNRYLAAETLKRHGATQDEINFLIREKKIYTLAGELEGERVELNAMTSDELITFIEGKFEEHGVSKVVPDDDVLELHARRMLERRMVLREMDKLLPDIRKRVADTALPADLQELVEGLLEEQPAIPWDAAVAEIINRDDGVAP
jgi:DNA topoisomerase VI subunit A